MITSQPVRFCRPLIHLGAGAAILCLLLGPVGLSYAATSGTSDVILEATATAEISVTDASITLTPSQADYEAGFVVAEGAAGIAVDVRTNSSTGMTLSVKCSDGVPEIELADLLFKTATAAGAGGSTISTYTVITAVDQTLWSTGTTQETWATVDTDIRIQDLWTYPDAGGGGTTTYTNTLTYTVAVQ